MNAARRNGAVWLVVLGAGLGCSSSSASSSGDSGGRGPTEAGTAQAFDAGGDARGDALTVGEPDAQVTPDANGPDTGGGPDATSILDASSSPDATTANDAAGGDPIALLGSCVGTSMPVLIAYQTPNADLSIGTEQGYFAVDFGSTFSSIDLTAFASPGPTTSGCNAQELDQTCTVADFTFFGATSSVELVTEDYSGLGGTPRQAGIVGTDLLSEHVVTLDYAASTAYASEPSTFCSTSALTGAGFARLTTQGYYENDLSQLAPATAVDSNDSAEDSVPNVPTVAVSVADVAAIAQLDTGFDDDVTPFSVNINEAYYQAIVAAHPQALVRASSLDESLSTCTGGTESVKAYTLASGTVFAFVKDGGTNARSYPQATLFVKNTPSSSASCGGIGTWTVPAAQVGASFYIDMKGLVLDPFSAAVWVPVQ